MRFGENIIVGVPIDEITLKRNPRRKGTVLVMNVETGQKFVLRKRRKVYINASRHN